MWLSNVFQFVSLKVQEMERRRAQVSAFALLPSSAWKPGSWIEAFPLFYDWREWGASLSFFPYGFGKAALCLETTFATSISCALQNLYKKSPVFGCKFRNFGKSVGMEYCSMAKFHIKANVPIPREIRAVPLGYRNMVNILWLHFEFQFPFFSFMKQHNVMYIWWSHKKRDFFRPHPF